MTWDEFQDLHLKIACEVGAEQNLRAELIDPEVLHPEPFDLRPRPWAFTLRSLFRRPKLREIALAFYRPDDPTQPYSKMGHWVDVNE